MLFYSKQMNARIFYIMPHNPTEFLLEFEFNLILGSSFSYVFFHPKNRKFWLKTYMANFLALVCFLKINAWTITEDCFRSVLDSWGILAGDFKLIMGNHSKKFNHLLESVYFSFCFLVTTEKYVLKIKFSIQLYIKCYAQLSAYSIIKESN